MPRLARINIFPIKSLDGVQLLSARIGPGGVIVGDRQFAICDLDGKFVNGKRTTEIHRIRSNFDLDSRTVTLSADQRDPDTFHLDTEHSRIASWLSEFFGFEVALTRNNQTGFPDDTEAPGPTIISVATLQTLTDWYPGLDLDDLRRRFRANLEISETPPFWVDQLFSSDSPKDFKIDGVTFFGHRSSQRCVVPTRDPLSGTVLSGFQKRFATLREQSLPAWAPSEMFNHYYRLATNTSAPTASVGQTIRLGSAVSLSDPTPEGL